jgi:hypothetical protein
VVNRPATAIAVHANQCHRPRSAPPCTVDLADGSTFVSASEKQAMWQRQGLRPGLSNKRGSVSKNPYHPHKGPPLPASRPRPPTSQQRPRTARGASSRRQQVRPATGRMPAKLQERTCRPRPRTAKQVLELQRAAGLLL